MESPACGNHGFRVERGQPFPALADIGRGIEVEVMILPALQVSLDN